MARTKRAKVVSLTRTKAKSRENKESLMENVRGAAQQYSYAWVFAVGNMRNTYLGEVRSLWQGSKIFFGKLRVIAKALGETPEEEIRPGFGALSTRLRGNVGLLFTDSPPAEVLDWCSDYRRIDFARTGSKAARTVELKEGPVMFDLDPPEALPHSLEPQLRALGMPTQLKNGVPTLLQDYTVCKKGEVLSAEQAQILKHLLIQMAHFRLVPLAYWSAVGKAGEGKDTEGAVVDVELSEEDRELVQNSGALLGAKESRKSASRSQAMDEEELDEDLDEEDDGEMDPVEARESAMMLPEGVKL